MTTITEALGTAEDHMKKALANLLKEFQSVRTGRANPALLDRVEVEYYGTATPLKSLSNISVSEGRTLVIQPYDKSALKDIEQAVHKSGLGLTPNNDGSVIRINIPALTEERRKELTKVVKKYAEESRVAVRNIRRNTLEDFKKLKTAQISEDEVKRQEEALQKITDRYIKDIDKMTSEKEAEVMEV